MPGVGVRALHFWGRLQCHLGISLGETRQVMGPVAPPRGSRRECKRQSSRACEEFQVQVLSAARAASREQAVMGICLQSQTPGRSWGAVTRETAQLETSKTVSSYRSMLQRPTLSRTATLRERTPQEREEQGEPLGRMGENSNPSLTLGSGAEGMPCECEFAPRRSHNKRLSFLIWGCLASRAVMSFCVWLHEQGESRAASRGQADGRRTWQPTRIGSRAVMQRSERWQGSVRVCVSAWKRRRKRTTNSAQRVIPGTTPVKQEAAWDAQRRAVLRRKSAALTPYLRSAKVVPVLHAVRFGACEEGGGGTTTFNMSTPCMCILKLQMCVKCRDAHVEGKRGMPAFVFVPERERTFVPKRESRARHPSLRESFLPEKCCKGNMLVNLVGELKALCVIFPTLYLHEIAEECCFSSSGAGMEFNPEVAGKWGTEEKGSLVGTARETQRASFPKKQNK